MKIVLEFDENALTYTDSYLAALWHAAQFNPAPGEDRDACRGAELIGREIIRRWLEKTPPELWHRQGVHALSLPVIDRNAKVNAVLEAAWTAVDQDHGSNLSDDRDRACRAVESLRIALASLRQKSGNVSGGQAIEIGAPGWAATVNGEPTNKT